jgi:plastocyanin
MSRTGPAILGIAILIAVLTAGCTSPSGPTPTTTQVTTVLTTAPATPAATTRVPTTTMPLTTAATTATTMPPVTTTTAAPVTPGMPTTADVAIQNFAFNPASLTIAAGTTVTWTNLDSPTHTIVSDATSNYQVGALFMSGQLTQGQKFSFTFSTPGTYLYHCGIHTFMKGTITVT